MIFNNLVSPSVFDVLLVFITLLGISFCLIAVLKLHLLFIIIIFNLRSFPNPILKNSYSKGFSVTFNNFGCITMSLSSKY